MSKQGIVHVDRSNPRTATVTFADPPTNVIIPETVARLHEVVVELSTDERVQVVVFASGTEGFFFNHFDLRQAARFPFTVGPDGSDVPTWVDLVLRLSKAPFVSIAKIRGRTRGGGNEFALACDLRYASREQALFGQPEVGTGILPGGGGSERLPRLIGRDRGLEAILTSQDYDAGLAERYGWITRSLPDDELDAFVDGISTRIASFDKTVVAAAKAQINRASLPPDADLSAAYAEYTRSLSAPAFQAGLARLGRHFARGGLEVELRLGEYLGTNDAPPPLTAR